MSWVQIRDGSGLVVAVFLPLWLLNFLAYFIVSLCIGGTWFYGYNADGKYFLATGGNHVKNPPTEVSEQVYHYSVYHHYSIIALACVFGPAFLVWVIASSVCRRSLGVLEVRVTPQRITLDGQPISIARVIEVLQETMQIYRDHRPEIRIVNDYKASDAPQHAVALQLELMRHQLIVLQEPPRVSD